MKQFYETYKDNKIVTPLVTQISWTMIYKWRNNMVSINLGKKSTWVAIVIILVFVVCFLMWLGMWHEIEHSDISKTEGRYREGGVSKDRDTSEMLDVANARVLYYYAIELTEGSIELEVVDYDTGEEMYKIRYDEKGTYADEIPLNEHVRIESRWYCPNTEEPECYIEEGLRWYKKKGYKILLDKLSSIF